MPASYFAPEFRVKINGANLEADVSRNIMHLSVVHEPDTMDHFNLSLANPYPEMPWTHDEQKANLFKEGNAIQIKMGYVDDLHDMFEGIITGISPSFPNNGTPTVEIEGYTQMRRLQGDSKTYPFQNITDKEIAEQIAKNLHLSLEADETRIKHPYVIQFNQTDLAFLLERAGRINFEVQVEGGVLHFRRARNDQEKLYTLVWGRPRQEVDPSQHVMPLKQFTPSLNTQRQISRVIVRGQHPTSRETIEGQAGEGDEETSMGGSQTGPQAAAEAMGEGRELVITTIPVFSQEEADQIARAIYNDLAMKFITGSGSTIGLPDLRAGRTIELVGLGPRFSGRYYVTQTTHAISDSGYETSFSVERNSAG